MTIPKRSALIASLALLVGTVACPVTAPSDKPKADSTEIEHTVPAGNVSGTAGHPLASPLSIRVLRISQTDTGTTRTPMPGVTVSWSVGDNRMGSVNPTSSVTDASGVATTQWTLGYFQGNGGKSSQAAKAKVGAAEAGFVADVAAETFRAVLNGASVRPVPLTTGSSGTIAFSVGGYSDLTAGTADALRYDFTLSGCSPSAAECSMLGSCITAAHVHGPTDGSSPGPIVYSFTIGANDGSCNGVRHGGSLGGTVEPEPGAIVNAIVRVLRTGKGYVDIHTSGAPNGEIGGDVKEP